MGFNFQIFKNKWQKKSVVEFANKASKNVLVSVCVQTYNHSNYIKACLDSILKQETKFDFEILLGEDESSDGTREICLEYAKKHPERLKLFLHRRENNIKVNGQPTGRFNILYNLFSARGKYIAICEGDDYWTDPLKLQKQVDQFNQHPETSLVFTNAQRLLEGKLVEFYPSAPPPVNFDLYKFVHEGFNVATASVMIKSEVVSEITNLNPTDATRFFHMDYFMWCIAGKYGSYRFLNEYTTVYRIHSTSLMRTAPPETALQRGMEMNHFLVDKVCLLKK